MKQIKITLIVLGATLLIAACSNDNLQSSQEQSKSIDRAHLTAFTTGGKTRTTADYDGTGISFCNSKAKLLCNSLIMSRYKIKNKKRVTIWLLLKFPRLP